MPVRIELAPSLEHCIETTARREFAKSSGEYLRKGGNDPRLEERIEALKEFLESADFRALRSESEKHLTAGRRVTFTLRREGGKLTWEMKVH